MLPVASRAAKGGGKSCLVSQIGFARLVFARGTIYEGGGAAQSRRRYCRSRLAWIGNQIAGADFTMIVVEVTT